MREFHRHPVEAPSLALAHTYKARLASTVRVRGKKRYF